MKSAAAPARLQARLTNSLKKLEMTDIGMTIMPAGEGVTDFAAVGAMVHRLDAGHMPARKATNFSESASLRLPLRAPPLRWGADWAAGLRSAPRPGLLAACTPGLHAGSRERTPCPQLSWR